MSLSLRSLTALTVGAVFCIAAVSPAQGAAPTPSRYAPEAKTIAIPGPLRSFLRMAGISQEVSTPNVLPMLARNISVWGYENGHETEFLRLIIRYVHLARELRRMAAPDGKIHVANCNDALPLVHALGYDFQKPCGQKDSYLQTADAGRAFLTVDSGFPLTQLEQDLQNGVPFTYSFPATEVPVLATRGQWAAISPRGRRTGGDMLDILLFDPEVDRLYSALARIDPQTQDVLLRSPGLSGLLPYADIFDFYGSQICIRNGAVQVPGGTKAEAAWRELVGASPDSRTAFVTHLLARDRGWLVAYFDALARVNPTQQAYFTQGSRLKDLYDAWRSMGTRIGAAEGVFPRNANLVLLFTRMQWQANGDPRIPGDIAEWRGIFAHQDRTTGLRNWAKHEHDLNSPEQLLEGLTAAANLEINTGPLQIYLALSAIDRGRAPGHQLSAATIQLLVSRFDQYNTWYQIFSEFPELDDTSITGFIEAANRVSGISNPTLRANALGAFQADVGLWEIFTRQGQIPAGALNASWQNAVNPFRKELSELGLFEAARSSLQSMVVAAGGAPDLTENEVVDLLAGPPQSTETGRRVHDRLVNRIQGVLDAQRLVSLDTLFGLFDGLNQLAHGQPVTSSLLQMANDLREFELPRPIFTGSERTSWSPVVYSSRHAELQVRTDLTKVIRQPASPSQLEAARGKLAPFLRDTLVGLNYAYYEPPGAQVLRSNPLFVRAHDFSAASVEGVKDIWGAPVTVGVGVTAGGGAFLMGSLADLPYALASMEEDFIAPSHVQALIWRETVPVLLTDAVVPRWWGVTRDQLHAVALYQREGEELLTASATNAQLHAEVIGILADCMTSNRLVRVEDTLQNQQSITAFLPEMLPTETFYLAAEFHKRFASQESLYSEAGRALSELAKRDTSSINMAKLERIFGVPHPEIAESDKPSLLFTGMFPVSGGYANRFFGESWESSNLYWARLADEMGYSPAMLNLLVPRLTHNMVANIFGTSIDDWPALLRAMHQTGRSFREGKIDTGDERLLAVR